MNSCFPDPEVQRCYPRSIISNKLLDARKLTPREEERLKTIVKRLHDKDTAANSEDEEEAVAVVEDDEDNTSVHEACEHGEGTREREKEAFGQRPVLRALMELQDSSSETASTLANSLQPKRKSIFTRSSVAKKICNNVSAQMGLKRVTPEKPDGVVNTDENQYRVIQLSNGLRAILIQTPTADKAALSDNEAQDYNNNLLDTVRAACDQNDAWQRPKHLPFDGKTLPLANLVMGELIAKRSDQACASMGDEGSSSNPENKAMRLNLSRRDSVSFCCIVNVGFADDPTNCRGLAHFTEHMVHYGSTKYPREEEYMEFAQTQGYGVNAFTQMESTTYFNSLPAKCIHTGMDRMANMLFKPLFPKDMVLREINAVDSEYNLRKHIHFLERIAVLTEALAGHPIGNFGCGNEQSLKTPKSIHKTLREFHQKYYVASAMTVGLQSTLSLDEQEKIVTTHFSRMPKGKRGILRETRPAAKETRIPGNIDVVMKGRSSIANLWLLWPISEVFLKDFKNRSVQVLSKLLWDEAEGSLAHYLAENNFCWLTSCNSMIHTLFLNNKYTTFFTIEFMLTTEGQANVPKMVQATFAYFQELAKIPDAKWDSIFAEMKSCEQRVEKHVKESKSFVDLAAALQEVEPEKILNHGSWTNSAYSAQEVRTILSYLRSDNLISIQTLPSATPLTEFIKGVKVKRAQYTDIEYVLQPAKKRFGAAVNTNQVQVFDIDAVMGRMDLKNVAKYSLPLPYYGYVPIHQIQLKSDSRAKVIAAVHQGNQLRNYLSACVINYMDSGVLASPRNFALTLLWVTAQYFMSVQEIKNNYDYAIFLTPHKNGVALVYFGFEEKMSTMIESVNERLFSQAVTQENLDKAKLALQAVYDLAFAADAHSTFSEMMHYLFCKHSGDPLSDTISKMPECSLKDVNHYAESFKWNTIGTAMFAGNVSNLTARNVVDGVNKQGKKYVRFFSLPRFFWNSMIEKKTCYPYSNTFPDGERCLRFKSDLNVGFTTTVENFYCVGTYDAASYQLWRHCLILVQIKSFEYLRMKKQLGYHVGISFPMPMVNEPMIIGVFVTATGTKFTACELDKHIDQFMIYYGEYLNELTQDQYDKLLYECGRNTLSSQVDISAVRTFYAQYFGEIFASDDPLKYHLIPMYKLSMQMLPEEGKTCMCEKCQNVSDWVRGESFKRLRFARGQGEHKNYFIDDPRKIRNE